MVKAVKVDSLKVGDRLRFTGGIALLEVITREAFTDHGYSALVQVLDIRREDDGTLTVVLGPCEYSSGARL
jgi:hypothetical protein